MKDKNTLKTLVIDDESNSRNTLKDMLLRYCDIRVTGEADSVETGVELIKIVNPDLVFLDIKMNDGSGFDLLRRIENRDFILIFTTAWDQFAIKAFKFSALDYLLKPIDIEELKEAVKRALAVKEPQNIQKEKVKVLLENTFNPRHLNKVVLPTAEGMHVVEMSRIIRCQADDYYTRFFIDGRKPIMISKTLKEVEAMLSGNSFIRCHKSHLVNMKWVKTYVKSDGGYLMLSNGENVPVSRRKKEMVLQAVRML